MRYQFSAVQCMLLKVPTSSTRYQQTYITENAVPLCAVEKGVASICISFLPLKSSLPHYLLLSDYLQEAEELREIKVVSEASAISVCRTVATSWCFSLPPHHHSPKVSKATLATTHQFSRVFLTVSIVVIITIQINFKLLCFQLRLKCTYICLKYVTPITSAISKMLFREFIAATSCNCIP